MTVSPGLFFDGRSAVRDCSWSIMVVPNIDILFEKKNKRKRCCDKECGIKSTTFAYKKVKILSAIMYMLLKLVFGAFILRRDEHLSVPFISLIGYIDKLKTKENQAFYTKSVSTTERFTFRDHTICFLISELFIASLTACGILRGTNYES